ncbi:DUF292-domain-containing protein [Laetiporus sulphureus 93-53]|uniref:DUF292-domain-containing protein n=1 Tax=Laetiporus sulphureus 93-53 TaxID=1314785 RepID=A0A165F8P1_9APHY|nr:DUF292-domain-containing protein [Laetiporus sulphureus 93-53]KZT08602.1 DUF292-domain-containing protein [Laetiporus sulphureus 93-53]
MAPWVSAKAKVQLRMAVQRLRTLQEKKGAQAKASRRDIAVLLEKGKLETARIKVENIIHEDIYVELLELLELYCELLHARFGLLDQNTAEPDPGVSEGVCSIIYAAPHTELKELHTLRDMLMHKYGRDFAIAVMENRDGCVSDRVAKKLVIATPSPSLVDAYLAEIAKGYGVKWSLPTPSSGGNDDSGEGGVKIAEPEEETLESPVPVKAATISAEARSAGMRTPKLPDIPPAEDRSVSEDKTAKPSTPPSPVEDGFEALTKRFEALKKR